MGKMRKNPKKPINKDEFEIAYNNSDNQNIIKSILKKYRKTLDYDTLKTCGLNALWRCLESHSDEYGTKFTSSLYKFTKWECDREIIKFNKKKKMEYVNIDEILQKNSNQAPYEITIFDDLESVLPPEHASIVRMKFVEDRTLKEIGEIFGYTKEAARQKLKVALKKLQEVYKEVWTG